MAFILLSGLGFIWLVFLINRGAKYGPSKLANVDEATERDIVDRIFSPEFREELKNRGRLHFEKIINENAEFLQQDLRLTSSQLNEFMKSELTSKVHNELSQYQQSINDARELAIDSIKKTSLALDEQRKVLGDQIEKEIQAQKARIIASFEKQLADIISHYLVAAIGSQIDLSDQLEYIVADLEANKKAIIEDLKSVSWTTN